MSVPLKKDWTLRQTLTLRVHPSLEGGPYNPRPIVTIYPDYSVHVPNWDRLIKMAQWDAPAYPEFREVQIICVLLLMSRGQLVERAEMTGLKGVDL